MNKKEISKAIEEHETSLRQLREKLNEPVTPAPKHGDVRRSKTRNKSWFKLYMHDQWFSIWNDSDQFLPDEGGTIDRDSEAAFNIFDVLSSNPVDAETFRRDYIKKSDILDWEDSEGDSWRKLINGGGCCPYSDEFTDYLKTLI